MTDNTFESELEKIDAKIECERTNADLWYEKGMILFHARKYQEAIDAFTEGLIYQPFHAGLRLQRGRRYITFDDYKTAIAELTLATRLAPENYETWYYQGVALYLEGQYERCMDAALNCISVLKKFNGGNNLPLPITWYWQAAMKLGKYEEAKAILEYIYEDMPCEKQDYLEGLLLHKGLRKPQEMKQHMEHVDSDRSDLYKLGILFSIYNHYYYHGEIEEADKILQGIINLPCRHEAFCYKQALQEIRRKGKDTSDYVL